MKRHISISSLIQLLIFSCFIGVFFILNLVLPDKSFSEMENRYLEQAPKFTLSNLFSGKFTSAFETYTTDQFTLRDDWIDLKSYTELALLKKENNGVYIGKGETLLTRFSPPDAARLKSNADAVNALVKNVGADVYLALAPSAAEIWADRLPANAPTADQKSIIDGIYAGSSARTVDICSALKQHSGEYIYYRTDHHWTTLGAYYGYAATARAMGLVPSALDSFTPVTVSDRFYGTVFSNSGIRWVAPDSISIYVPENAAKQIMNYNTGTALPGVMYDYSFLNKKDKYALFFGGNTPEIRIVTGNAGGRLLILRDSYMDSELPFLLAHFSEIRVLDLRYFKGSVSDYVKTNGIDTVLVSYSLSDFVTDSSVFLAGR